MVRFLIKLSIVLISCASNSKDGWLMWNMVAIRRKRYIKTKKVKGIGLWGVFVLVSIAMRNILLQKLKAERT